MVKDEAILPTNDYVSRRILLKFLSKNIEKSIKLWYTRNNRRVINMMHPYCKYYDGTEVVFSDLRKNENEEDTIWVSFERPTESGFDTIIFEIPSYRIIRQEGNYKDEEIALFKTVVERGAATFFEFARKGGANIA